MFFKKIQNTSRLLIFSMLFVQVAFALFNPKPVHALDIVMDPGAIASINATGATNAAAINADTAATTGAVTASQVAIIGAIVVALGLGASLLSSSNMNGVMDDVEKRYHVDTAAVANMGETMNTSATKESAPQVNLFFNPTDPKVGQEITAQAFPLYFSSQTESMYFTWYLKRKGCDVKSGNLSDEEKNVCDLDDSGSITVNDWKIEAMRRIANGGFTGDQVDYGKSSNDDDGYKAQFGGDKSKSQYCYVHNFDDGLDYEIRNPDTNAVECKHLFPNPKTGDVTGDGSFGKDEEKFWHTDPQDPSTAQNGNKDEANIVGFGQDKFTWNYASDDQVGVVIEGLSMLPTKHEGSSMKIMWAFTKNKCLPSSIGEPIVGAAYNGGNASIPTASIDLNKCIADNLITPTEGNQASKLEVKMSTSPDSPIIDSFSKANPDNRGDVLTAQSVLVNSEAKNSNVSYEWRVFANSNKSQTDDSAWEDITDGLVGAHAISNTKGNDLGSLRINLNIDESTTVRNGKSFFDRYFKDDMGYIRISVIATENFDTGKKRVGRSSTTVKLMHAQTQIQTHTVDVDTSAYTLKFATPTSTDDGLLCEGTSADRAICPVVKGQVIGLSFDAKKAGFDINKGSNITWVLNNQTIHCNEAVSKDAGCLNGTKNFFPVTGDAGEVYVMTLTASDPVSGKSLTLSRTFRVVEPSVTIVPADSTKVWPRLLGQYIDINGKTSDDYSRDIFEAFSGTPFSLQGLFYPNSLKNGANVSWSVDGVTSTPDSAGIMTIDASQPQGAIYTAALNGIYVPSPQVKKAISSIWGITIADVSETTLTKTIQIEMVQSIDGLAMGPLGGTTKFFASIISYVPTSVIFLFRLLLTVGLILAVLAITFAFVPERKMAQ